MKAFEQLQYPNFRELLDMTLKGFIDREFSNAGKNPPIPSSLTPLDYSHPELSKAVSRLRKGGEIALFAYDKHMSKGQ